VLGSPVVGVDGTIYIATSGTVHAISPDGSAKWKVKIRQSCMTSPVLAADGTMYIGCDIGLFALNSDGSEKWYMRTGTVNQSPTISPDGTIYFPCGYMWVCAAKDGGSPLAKSAWPKIYHDAANTSRILTPF
jgi:outer membrane protein assembly factor BamB